MTAKIALRKQVQSILNNLGSAEKVRQSKVVVRKVLQNDKFRAAKSVSIYLNMDDEVQTEDLVTEIFNQGKTCYIPRFKFGKPEMEMIRLASLAEYENLPKNKWNIKQPPDDVVIESVFDRGELDLVLTPGLAFTSKGDRLGRGKGYYDRFFEKCKNELKSFPYLIGLAFNEQILPEIPTTENDIRLDLVFDAKT
ncbi:UNVERIFIED_CONTAM: hypothetical protein PYX00_007430 [Menopon gallinae]|uniref:5-formyltetrahydrofolate cyclo-ligase n=1 Tax=Menopon gallinae TaxID=328185 RepID=A0AAW2HJ55_9NEOP